MKNKLYFYSFPANYEDQIALGKTPQLKIGETSQQQVEDRIQQQMGTATPQKYTVYGQFEASFSDKQFHAFLRKRGFTQPDGAGTEWFLITAEEATQLVYEFAAQTEGAATPIRDALDVRPYQQQFVVQFCKTTGAFLLFAKCRSGKSAMSLLAATEAGYRSMLVLSFRTSAITSWRDDAKRFTAFHEWDVVDFSEFDFAVQVQKSIKAGRRVLMVGTVQGADEKLPRLPKLKTLFPNGIDLGVIDECHIGGDAASWKQIQSKINFGRVLEVSGTAYKSVWGYPKSNVFVWGYTQEQQAKARGYAWAQKLPKMEIILVRCDAEEKARIYADGADRVNNLWTIKSGEWQDSGSVRNFIDKYFAHGGQVRKQQQLLHGSDHILMALNSAEACKLMAKTFEEMDMPWAPLSITGDSGNSQAEILNHVKKYNKTICFTRWANVVGVTVPEWRTMINAANGSSAEFWVQFAFRGGSTRDKTFRVIDFAPERAVSAVVEMAQITATAEEETKPQAALRTLMDFADIHEFFDGFNQLDYHSVLEIACEDIGELTSATRTVQRLLVQGDQFAEELIGALSGVSPAKDIEVLNETINQNGTNDRGNVQLQREESNPRKPNELKRLLAQLASVIGDIPQVIWSAALEGQELSTVPQLLAYPQFNTILGKYASEVVSLALKGNWINERALNSLVSRNFLFLSHVAEDAS